MTLIPLLLLLLVASIYGRHSDCNSCIPHPTEIHWISRSKPPCLHPGQPIFEWPGGSNCRRPPAFHSSQVSVDETGLVFAKQRMCFYFTIELVEYSYECEGDILTERFTIGHPVFSKQRRFKRWLRRRNPDPNAIHFQQERWGGPDAKCCQFSVDVFIAPVFFFLHSHVYRICVLSGLLEDRKFPKRISKIKNLLTLSCRSTTLFLVLHFCEISSDEIWEVFSWSGGSCM